MTATLFDPPALNSSVPTQDRPRLLTQLERVAALMADGRERTLAEIARAAGGSEPSVSARLRDLRKHGETVTRRRDGGRAGVWWYRVGTAQA